MKKRFLIILSIIVLATLTNSAYSKASSTELSNAIRLYKAHNYSQCYSTLENIIKKDPSNALAYYYYAMANAQLGKKEDAISNYEKAMSLTNISTNLYRYAEKGKICIESPDKCHEPIDKDAVKDLYYKKDQKFSNEARSEFERLKIENMMREMNRNPEVDSNKFKEYRDFSSMNNTEPTDEDVVAAIRTLQNAGLGNLINGYSSNDILMNNNTNTQFMNMLGGQNMTPQMIQTMLTNNMLLGF